MRKRKALSIALSIIFLVVMGVMAFAFSGCRTETPLVCTECSLQDCECCDACGKHDCECCVVCGELDCECPPPICSECELEPCECDEIARLQAMHTERNRINGLIGQLYTRTTAVSLRSAVAFVDSAIANWNNNPDNIILTGIYNSVLEYQRERIETLVCEDCKEDICVCPPIPENALFLIQQELINRITIHWERVEGAVSYRITRGGSRLGERHYLATIPATDVRWQSFTDTNPFANRLTNYYSVTALDENNNRIILGLEWRPWTNARRYDIQRRSNVADPFETIATQTEIVGAVVVNPKMYSFNPSFGVEGDTIRVVPFNAAGNRFTQGGNNVYITGGDVRPQFTKEISYERQLFGDYMLFYDPEFDNMADIKAEVNAIHDRMFTAPNSRELDGQFSFRRYSLNLKPGDYDYTGFDHHVPPTNLGANRTSTYNPVMSGHWNIGYFTSFSGLGRLPTETRFHGTFSAPAPLGGGNATCTFWRSIENFEFNGIEGDPATRIRLQWTVSQAAPARRLSVNTRTQFCFGPQNGPPFNMGTPWASGGFLADSRFTAPLGSPQQQQWYTRNSHFGHSQYSGDNWNRITHGVTGHPHGGTGFSGYPYESNWLTGGARTNMPTVPIVRERPFMYLDGDRYSVFVPDWRHDSYGISWDDETDFMGEGHSLDLETNFFIANPSHSAAEINAQLEKGMHVFFTPGWYTAEVPIRVVHPDTILLGTGYATIYPGANNREGAIFVEDVDGVIVAGLMLDALYDSTYLIRMGDEDADLDHSHNPSILHDIIIRVGGYMSAHVNATVSVQINSNDVIGDHLWVWRGDHGNGIGWCPIAAEAHNPNWHANTGAFGLIVSGDRVTMYGLFVEHYQKYETLWLGEYGNIFFYQNESPYDPTNQDAFISRRGMTGPGGEARGWASFKVANHVQNHTARNLGMYGVFNRTGMDRLQTQQVFMDNAIEVPHNPNVRIIHAMITELSDAPGPRTGTNAHTKTVNGTMSIINGTGGGVTNRTIAHARRVVSFNGRFNAQGVWEPNVGVAILPNGTPQNWTVCLQPTTAPTNTQTFPILRIGVQPQDECFFTLLDGLGQRLRPEWDIRNR